MPAAGWAMTEERGAFGRCRPALIPGLGPRRSRWGADDFRLPAPSATLSALPRRQGGRSAGWPGAAVQAFCRRCSGPPASPARAGRPRPPGHVRAPRHSLNGAAGRPPAPCGGAGGARARWRAQRIRAPASTGMIQVAAAQAGASRIAVMSPKGGVGKDDRRRAAWARLFALAAARETGIVAVDTNPDFRLPGPASLAARARNGLRRRTVLEVLDSPRSLTVTRTGREPGAGRFHGA